MLRNDKQLRREMKTTGAAVQDSADGFEPERAFETPMSEQFGVERGAEGGRNGFVEAGLPCIVEQGDEVIGVLQGMKPIGIADSTARLEPCRTGKKSSPTKLIGCCGAPGLDRSFRMSFRWG